MIDLYTWSTPNGRKASIMLEEVGLAYKVFPIDITKDEQFAPDFLKISPNNKIPAIVDHDTGLSFMESGAILIYLAEKTGQFLPQGDQRWEVLQWLMLQIGGIGPMLGQAHHFNRFKPEVSDYARERYTQEAQRLYGVLDKRLNQHEFLAGSEYTIADIATWPWISRWSWQGIDMDAFPNVKRWYLSIAQRKTVKRGHDVPKPSPIPLP